MQSNNPDICYTVVENVVRNGTTYYNYCIYREAPPSSRAILREAFKFTKPRLVGWWTSPEACM